MKIGILFQDLKKQKIPWQKNPEIYNRTAYRVVEMANALVELGHEIVIFSSLEDFSFSPITSIKIHPFIKLKK